MKVIYGALPSERGVINLNGRTVNPVSPQDGLANGIAYISEDRKGDGLVLGLSVKENMSLCALDQLSKGVQIRHADEVIAVDDFIRLFNIKPQVVSKSLAIFLGAISRKWRSPKD